MLYNAYQWFIFQSNNSHSGSGFIAFSEFRGKFHDSDMKRRKTEINKIQSQIKI